jgi:hypothetical protein
VVLSGEIGSEPLRVTLPALRPFSHVWVSVEVRGIAEPGEVAALGLWSPPSDPVELHAVPASAPDLISDAVVVRSATEDHIRVMVDSLAVDPDPGPFTVRLYRKEARANPWILLEPTKPAEPETEFTVTRPSRMVAGSHPRYRVVLVDPIGRAAPAYDVVRLQT